MMKITKETEPHSLRDCEWYEDGECWLFEWGEEIPDEWVAFSIEHGFYVELINKVYEEHPTEFELDKEVLYELLEDDYY